MDNESYKKEKLFRSELGIIYRAEVEVFEKFSMIDVKLIIRIFDMSKCHQLYEKLHLTYHHFSDEALDDIVKEHINKYEGWNIVE